MHRPSVEALRLESPAAAAVGRTGIASDTDLDLRTAAEPPCATRPGVVVAKHDGTCRAVHIGLSLLAFALLLWTCLHVLVMYFALAPRTDFGKFYYSAAAFVAGEDMYQWSPAIPDRLLPSITLNGQEQSYDLLNMNPPHLHAVLLPFVWLTPAAAQLAWLVLGLVCALYTLRIVNEELNLTWNPLAHRLGVVAFLGSFITLDVIQQGQVSWPLMLVVTLLWRDMRHGRWQRVGVLLGVLISIKAFFLILVPYFLYQRRFRALAVAAAATLGCFAAGVVVFGVDNYRSWLTALGHSNDWAWYPKNASLWAFLTRTLHENPIYLTLADVPLPTLRLTWLVVGGCMGLVTLVAACADRSPRGLDRALALLLVGVVLFNPLGWTYYYWLAAAPLAAVMVRWYGERRRACWCFLALALPGLAVWVWATVWWQPSAIATLLIGNLYFWIALSVWLTLVVDGLGHARFAWPRPARQLHTAPAQAIVA